jgi:tetratricopeptide (TPR) repeat protein
MSENVKSDDDHWNDFAHFIEQLESKVFADQPTDRDLLLDQLKNAVDNRDRVRIAFTNERLTDKLNHYVTCLQSQLIDQGKDEQEAKVYRVKADELFESDDFADALETYSAAIAKAPASSAELAKSYQKRAEVLFVLKKYDHCARDIELALEHGYEPKEQLIEMKTDCDEKLQRLNENRTIEEAPAKFVSNNSQLYCASDKIQIKREKGKGRLVCATADLDFGDRLLVERPFAVLLDQQYYLAFCSNCLKQLNGLGLPCPGCDHALYCSNACRSAAADSYHANECNRILDLQNDLGVAYFPIRVLLKVGLDRVLALNWDQIQPTQSQDAIENEGTDRIADDYASVLSLMSHEKEMDVELQLQYVMTAILIKTLLIKLDVVRLTSTEDELKVCALILLHLQQMHSNLVAVVNHVLLEQFSKEGLDGGEEMQIGFGVYPGLSLFNHSCQPNVLAVFAGAEVQISSARALKQDEELYFCYGPSVNSATRRDRREALRRQYFFECACSACESGVESRAQALICQKCNGPVLEHRDLKNQCLNCGLQDQKIDREKIDKSMESLRKGRYLMQSEQHYTALQFVVDAYAELREHLHRHNRELRKCLENLYECYAMIGYFDIACCYCEIVVKITREVFGPDSVEAGNERVKLASLRLRAIETLEADKKIEAKARSEELVKDIDDIVGQFERLQVQVKQRLNDKQQQRFEQFEELTILADLKDKANKHLS